MFNITFGYDLDGYKSAQSHHTLGEVVFGPLSFLDFLEMRLGLRGIIENEPIRIIQYLDCLHQVDSGQRFYSRSLIIDEIAVAKTLLKWRDTWIEAGWNGQAQAGDSQRIQDLAAVELHCKNSLSTGISDRLVSVFDALKTRQLNDLHIQLKDAKESFSYVWQQILNQLNTVDAQSEFIHSISAPDGSDLACLQEAVLKNESVELQGDGTVLFLSAHNEGLLARGVAQILHEQVAGDDTSPCSKSVITSVVNGGGIHTLDYALGGNDLPVTGSSMLSRWRPPLQLLSLSLSLLWTPLDPQRLLEFLTHTVSPLSRSVRHQLATVVAEYPGIGGKPWIDAVEKLQDQAKKRDNKQGDGKSSGDTLVPTIDAWLQGKRFCAEEGAPIAYVLERCTQLSQWAAAQAEREGIDSTLKGLFFLASAQAVQVKKILEQMMGAGREQIDKLQLEKLLDQVTEIGVTQPGVSAELGHAHLLNSPAATIEPNERIIWWNFTEPQLPPRWPWSGSEIKQLAENGAYLPSVKSQLQRLSATWLRPLFAATQQLLLTAPRTAENKAVRHHPLKARLDALTCGAIPEIDIRALLAGEKRDSRLPIALEAVSTQELPQPKRWWQLENPQLLTPRNKESFSSLQAFIDSPYQWVLRYQGKLYPSTLAHIDDNNRQKGNLLHRFIERLFESTAINWQTATQQQLSQWVGVEFQQLLQEEGANYLLPGKYKDQQELAEITDRTVWTLVEHMRAAKVVKVEIEKEVKGTFIGGNLTGSIDMLLTNSSGEEFVLDLKWGGGKYRQQQLRDNSSLQLILYAYLRKANNKWPAHGYYIFRETRLLAQDNSFFPHAESCPPPEGENDATFFLSFEKAWKWRRNQLDVGLIELTVEGTTPDDLSVPDDGALTIDDCNDHFNDFFALTGWKEGI